MEYIDEIEQELQQLLERDKTNWIKTAKLLLTAEKKKLYLEHACDFTAWINQLSHKFGIHTSNFWRIKKAGDYYLKLNHTEDVNVIDDAKSYPEQIEILHKINKVVPEPVFQDLEARLIEGKTTRKELRDIWTTYRPLKKDNSKSTQAINSKNPSGLSALLDMGELENVDGFTGNSNKSIAELQHEFSVSKIQQAFAPDSKDALSAPAIIEALKNFFWVDEYHNSSRLQLFTEIAVRPGTTRSARRIDVVGVYRKDFKSPMPEIYGIEIKVDLHDLKNDHKMAEYLPFCHHFYLAIPDTKEFIELAENLIHPEIGIIAIHTKKVVNGRFVGRVVKKASLLTPKEVFLYEISSTLLMKSLKWI